MNPTVRQHQGKNSKIPLSPETLVNLVPCVRRGQFDRSLHSSGTTSTSLRSAEKRTVQEKNSHPNGISVSPSFRLVLTQFGDDPNLCKERAFRPLLTQVPSPKIAKFRPSWEAIVFRGQWLSRSAATFFCTAMVASLSRPGPSAEPKHLARSKLSIHIFSLKSKQPF